MKSVVSNKPPVSFQANREHDNSFYGCIQPRTGSERGVKQASQCALLDDLQECTERQLSLSPAGKSAPLRCQPIRTRLSKVSNFFFSRNYAKSERLTLIVQRGSNCSGVFFCAKGTKGNYVVCKMFFLGKIVAIAVFSIADAEGLYRGAFCDFFLSC